MMKSGKNYCYFVFIILFPVYLFSFGFYDNELFNINGYIKELPEFNYQHDKLNLNNILHLRLNTKWYLSDNVTGSVDVRTRLFRGYYVDNIPGFSELINQSNDTIKLSKIILDNSGYVLHTMIDRFWIEWINDNLQIRFGKQRINWGVNYIWNPNDFFNTYSYFDYDYEERPGIDGIRVQYYTGPASSIEIAAKIDTSLQRSVVAGAFKINKWLYDFRTILAYYDDNPAVGFSWSGQIYNAGFRGEMTYFLSDNQNKNFVGSISGDYMFQNTLYFHSEFLFNKNGVTGPAGTLLGNNQISVQNLSPARYSIFFQTTYDITPLIHSDISMIINPSDRSYFLSPSSTWSIITNLDLMILLQLFHGDSYTEFDSNNPNILAVRLKYSF